MLADRFASIAGAVSARFGGPYHAARLIWPGTPVEDAGGSIITPGTPVIVDCQAQIDVCTEAMRLEAGYTDRDMRMLILAPGLSRPVDSDATLEVLAGPHTGQWSIAGASFDTMGFAFDGRGRVADPGEPAS